MFNIKPKDNCIDKFINTIYWCWRPNLSCICVCYNNEWSGILIFCFESLQIQHRGHATGVVISVKCITTALRWTISIFCSYFFWWGFHAEAQYSRLDLTIVIYAFVFVSDDADRKWRLRKPNMLLRFFVTLSMSL